MGVNKWIHDGEVKFDISGITITPEALTKGYTAVNAQGDFIEGAVKTETWELTYDDGRVEEVEVAVL